jgi:HNH endonuclease
MIGLLISVVIEGIALMIGLLIFALRLIVRGTVILIALIASAVATRRRTAARTGTRTPLDNDLRWAVFQRDGYACVHCGSRLDLTIDHIHPVSMGGLNSPENLQTLCRNCNSRKGVS